MYAFFIPPIRHLLESTALKISSKTHKLFSLPLLHYLAFTHSSRDTDLPLLIDQVHQNKKQNYRFVGICENLARKNIRPFTESLFYPTNIAYLLPAAVSKSMCGSQLEGTVYTTNEPTGLDKIIFLYITIPAIPMLENPVYTWCPRS